MIIRFLSDGGFKTITLSTSIIAEDETAESLSKSIMQTFKESGALLDAWRDVTVQMYPAQVDLLDMIPKGSDLTLSKLAKQGMITTDTCATAWKFQRLLITEITALAEKEGCSPVEIKFFEGDCWQHLQNIWFGAVVKQLSKMLTELLEDDLNKIPSIFCMSTEMMTYCVALRKNLG